MSGRYRQGGRSSGVAVKRGSTVASVEGIAVWSYSAVRVDEPRPPFLCKLI